MVFPGLDIKADGCKFYKEWTEDVLNLISVVHVTTLSLTIMNIGRNIGEKNKTLPIALKNEELEEE
jgi:hypothetical protein